MLSRPILTISSFNNAAVDVPCRPAGEAPAASAAQPPTAWGARGVRQALAAARLGAPVMVLGSVADDDRGRQWMAALRAQAVDCACLRAACGAASGISAADLDAAEEAIGRAAVCLLHLEMPIAAVEHAIVLCRRHDVETILDAAAQPGGLPSALFQVDILCCDEVGAAQLTGLSAAKSPRAVAAALEKRGCRSVVLRLGERGAYAFSPECESAVPGFSVRSINAEAAGDVFGAALAVARSWRWNLSEAIRFANAAGALACSRTPGRPTMPTCAEVEALMADQL